MINLENFFNPSKLLICLKKFCQILRPNNNFYISVIAQYSQIVILPKYLIENEFFHLVLIKFSNKQVYYLL